MDIISFIKQSIERGMSYREIAETDEVKQEHPGDIHSRMIFVKNTYWRKIRVKGEEQANSDTVSNKTVEYKASDGTTTFDGIVALQEGEEITPESIMKAHNLDCRVWDVISYKNNYYQQQAKGGKILILYQSKIVVKPKKDGEISIEMLKEHFNKLQKTYIHDKQIVFENRKSKKMLEINISDLHFAKLSWAPECGENYDYKIAEKNFMKIVDTECERLSTGEYEKVLFVWTNDFFNSDNPSNTTTGGTPQSTDLRWQKMFLKGVEMLVTAIEKFQRYAPVKTFYIASNHCRTVEFYAINYLYAWFKDNDRVDIDINCKSRYYYQYGINLIGFSHSYYEKKQNLQGLMSIEVPEMWADTKYREYHLAHLHSEQTEEKGGIVFRWLPSVTGTDQWHYDSGFIGAFKRSYSFAWNYERGLESIQVVHIGE